MTHNGSCMRCMYVCDFLWSACHAYCNTRLSIFLYNGLRVDLWCFFTPRVGLLTSLRSGRGSWGGPEPQDLLGLVPWTFRRSGWTSWEAWKDCPRDPLDLLGGPSGLPVRSWRTSWVSPWSGRHRHEIIQEAKSKVRLIRERLRVAQSRQISYVDNRRRELSFETRDFVYLKVTPLRRVRRFQTKGKLAPRFVGSYKIVGRRGEVAYQLELPESLSAVHNVFHVSQLKKCLRVTIEQTPLESINLQDNLTYVEQPIKILDVAERVIRSKVIRSCKVQ